MQSLLGLSRLNLFGLFSLPQYYNLLAEQAHNDGSNQNEAHTNSHIHIQ
jgi:hypothetical protein